MTTNDSAVGPNRSVSGRCRPRPAVRGNGQGCSAPSPESRLSEQRDSCPRGGHPALPLYRSHLTAWELGVARDAYAEHRARQFYRAAKLPAIREDTVLWAVLMAAAGIVALWAVACWCL